MISCLRRAGADVVERHEPVWEGREQKWSAGAGAALRLAAAQARLLRRTRTRPDAVIVGYPGHLDLPAARRAARGAAVVFNPLVSLWDTLVEDRRRFAPDSVAAKVLRTLDRRAFGAADLVVADTEAHAVLFRELGARRVEVCFVGAEERVFRPTWRGTEPFTAFFVGKLIPLHGLETILAAACSAPEIRFRIVGSGQLDRLLDDRPPNVEWVRWVQYERLPAELGDAGCALGIFGTSAKAARVIPNKAFQALACGTPLVTADTPAARELLADGDSGLLVPPGDAAALAAAVRRLASDSALRERLSRAGRQAYDRDASEDVLGRRWRALLEGL